jgi:ABC-type phosphate transport system substrate-binding protein
MQLASRVGLILIGVALGLGVGAAGADVVAVVAAKSPISTLSKNQVVDIFLGKSARFPNGGAAVPIDQSEGSVLRDEFYSNFAGKSAAQIKACWSKIIFTGRGQPPKAVAGSLAMKKLIAENPAAIGYIDAAMVDESVKVVALTGSLAGSPSR